jgi:hypothetical protein
VTFFWGDGFVVKPVFMIFLKLFIKNFEGGLEEIDWRGCLQKNLSLELQINPTAFSVGIIIIWRPPLYLIIRTQQYLSVEEDPAIELISNAITLAANALYQSVLWDKGKSLFCAVFVILIQMA